jgi:3',5'-cyclic AMP phosphodiesterase CpdA
MIYSHDQQPHSRRNSPHESDAGGNKFVLAHLSDPHIACTSPVKKRDLLNKRLLGYLRWRLFRNRKHQDEILSMLVEDLKSTNPDHILVTGDLTHLGLPVEFQKAQAWLRSLGSPAQVSVVPGNHDTYVRSDWNETFASWLDYMASDRSDRHGNPGGGLDDLFPTLRVRGRIAMIGVCSARPCAPHLAVGTVGDAQLKKVETFLKQTAAQGLFRIVAIHHLPLSGLDSWRRRLTDAHSLSALIAHCGAELILHGHVHKAVHHTLDTPSGRIPVVGATSASSSSLTPERRACYYVYGLTALENAWDVRIAQRVYCPEAQCFVPGNEQHYRLHGPSLQRNQVEGERATEGLLGRRARYE